MIWQCLFSIITSNYISNNKTFTIDMLSDAKLWNAFSDGEKNDI